MKLVDGKARRKNGVFIWCFTFAFLPVLIGRLFCFFCGRQQHGSTAAHRRCNKHRAGASRASPGPHSRRLRPVLQQPA
ncbi:MAG: hypothetical protein ACK4ZJ_19515 [Allorhizobium sp.]